ncbi:hypothetical protein [Phenylobacterium kunshanense]|uniref:PA domain-containing protein n=1 Tax=Phenylobacterium kunshanense TaxID=1445034 RepID=A0A328BGR6_9CAUL|nr:hypothetical protein [Phenylobacterium kunshanense]RAK66303.1 hypothetical protein DJ019_08605 [Phenylobacterium kunshanense]
MAAGPSLAVAAPAASAEAEAQAILERYQAFGDKASGGRGDIACGEWLEGELKGLGYACARQPFDVPAYEGEAPTLSMEGAAATLIPQAIVQPTPAAGLAGRLYVPGRGEGDLALIVLPHARWSTAKGEVERRVRAAAEAGAKAAILVTTGPTGEALALNTPVDKPLFDLPAAVLAPRDSRPFVEGAGRGAMATFRMTGRSFRRPAFNVTARLDRGAGRWLVISTPRSGWFGCAGERGSGLAAWRMLVAWAAKAKLPVDVAVVATSGHEYEYAGGEHFIAHLAPKPAQTALWVHLGANVAARDWHERGQSLAPLPSADPQRFLLASSPLVQACRTAFAGQPGLEQAYPVDPKQVAGELASIVSAGYDPAMGIFGAHRFHHARSDDLRCVSPALVPPVAEAFKAVVTKALVG